MHVPSASGAGWPGRFVVVALVLALLWPAGLGASSRRDPSARRNHLAGEASPYLQLHVYNPVDWYPWGEEAFARARAEDKPIFLSIGYSTCYWCHVMERKVFSDPTIAKQMNTGFVNIKVDREERPDVDEIYMQATQLMAGRGGWPNSVFLTPDGKPFFAGTYFPPQDAAGRPGFPTVLSRLSQQWENERPILEERSARVAEAIGRSFRARPRSSTSYDPVRLLASGVGELARRYDRQYGGFSSRTKFPSPHQLELLLAAHERQVSNAGLALEMLTRTLDEMALGGIHDHLAGGFHRYSTEPTWSVPHFEKMLYDNAQLVSLYARAHRATGSALYRRVAEDVAQYLVTEMSHAHGGFYSAQDAEVDGEEGASYVWTDAELKTTLGPKRAEAFLAAYELVPVHRDARGPGALRLRRPTDAILARFEVSDVVALIDHFDADRERLLARRNTREQPLLDTKVLAAWNGLAIRGLVDAGVALDRPDYLERAAAAAWFVLARLADDKGRLSRSFIAGHRREEAVLDDYAFLVDGLMALWAATGERTWLNSAAKLADQMIAGYEGPVGAGFYLALGSRELFTRPRVLTDNVTPAGNSVALRALRDLAAATGDERYRAAAERTKIAIGDLFERSPSSVGIAVTALASSPAAPITVPLGDGRPPPQLPTGRDFVESVVRRDAAAKELVVTLQIAEGWHVNANPASLAFLIPTQIALVAKEAGSGEVPVPAAGAGKVVYPAGRNYLPRFALEPLSVYEGKVEIRVHGPAKLPDDARIELTFQACDATTCLPPETVPLDIPTA